jgi:hypothetical protein
VILLLDLYDGIVEINCTANVSGEDAASIFKVKVTEYWPRTHGILRNTTL